MKFFGRIALVVAAFVMAFGLAASPPASAQQKKPNILFIMGDDVGWFNVGAYHRGMMSGKTPNLDKLATHGMMFTDYYAEASCTAGRANFITRELPIRTGMTVGQAGSPIGLPAEASTIAVALKSMSWPGPKVTTDMPVIYNIRQDPFERLPILNFLEGAPAWFNEFFGREAFRFVFVQQVVGALGETAIEFPPMQESASFNLIKGQGKNHSGDQGA